jgi:hypothetical protein
VKNPWENRKWKDKRKEGNREGRKVTQGENGGTRQGKGEKNLRDL